MSGTPVKIGPFVNGLNILNEPTTIADTECVELINFDVDLDGSIVSRPPITAIDNGIPGGSHYIGMFISSTGNCLFYLSDWNFLQGL